jgi:ABC-type Co2+ transport system permease subunit
MHIPDGFIDGKTALAAAALYQLGCSVAPLARLGLEDA